IAVQPALARHCILTFIEPARSSIRVTGRGQLRWSGSAAQLYVGYQLGLSLYPGYEVPPAFTGELLAYLRRRDGDACFYCGRTVSKADATIEHVLSRTYGGPNHTANLVLAHLGCNAMAGALPVASKIRLREVLHQSLGRQYLGSGR